MSALSSRVDEAVAALREAEQRALTLNEDEDYRAIGADLGVGREAVADLLVSARLSVWAHLRDGTAPPRRTPQCGPARRVLAAQSDGEPVGASDLDRAREHLASCEPCTEARVALREAELACRTWRTTPPAGRPAPAVSPTGRKSDHQATRSARSALVVAGRRRLVAAAVGLVLLVAVVVAIAGGSDPAPTPGAPKTGPGSAQSAGQDVVPPPGDKFCPDDQPDCK